MPRPPRPSTFALLLAALALASSAAACGGDEQGSSSGAPSGSASTPGGEGPGAACAPEIREKMPPGLDPETCWSVYDGQAPVFADGKLFALTDDSDVADAPVLTAFDPATGELLWTSEPVEGQHPVVAAAEVDGEPGVAVVTTARDDGDALTESSSAWAYLAWPAAPETDGETPVAPAVRITAPAGPEADGVVWTDQGVLAGDQFLLAGTGEFTAAQVDPDDVQVAGEEVDEHFAGMAGELMMSYVWDLAPAPGKPDENAVYAGWVARSLTGEQVWDTIEPLPDDGEDVGFSDRPIPLAVVVGQHLLTLTPSDAERTDFELAWLDTANQQAAAPKANDLAGARPAAVETALAADAEVPLLSPDGRQLFVSWDGKAMVIDIEAGAITPVDSDYEITPTAIDNQAVYVTTPNGTAIIDLENAEATVVDSPGPSVVALDEEHGAAILEGQAVDEILIVGAREDSG